MHWNPEQWLDIPPELQRIPQWMVCGPDKAPQSAHGMTLPGGHTNPENWSSFADAYFYAEANHLWIGFCLLDDPFTIIDMDNKQANPQFTEYIRGTIDSLDTYVERSVSGLGYHAVVYGDIGPGRKQPPFELYSRARFMITTGDAIKRAPISSAYQNLLNQMAEWCGPASEHEQVLIDWTSPPTEEELEYDNRCLQWFATFRNVRDIERWFEGTDFQNPEYNRRSEDDAALMQLYYKFNAWRGEQRERATVRMFLRSPRATRYLMRKQDWQQYVARTLGFVKSRVLSEESIGNMVMNAANKTFAPVNGHMNGNATPMNGNIAYLPQPELKIVTNPIADLLYTASQLKQRPDIDWAVHHLFPIGGLAAIYGESGAGKSFLAIDLMAAIAQGTKWFDRVVKQLPVCCIALEGTGGLKQRVLAWEQAHKCDFPESALFYSDAFSLRAEQAQATRFSMPMMQPNIANISQFCGAINQRAGGKFNGVVFVDTLNQASEGADENSSKDMNQLINGMKLIQQQTGSLVIAVHHATKNRENQSMRGHGSFKAACDAVIEVYWDEESNNRAWRAEKVKDWQSGDKGSFKLELQMGTDSVAIQPIWENEEVHDAMTGEDYVVKKPVHVAKGRKKTDDDHTNGRKGSKPWSEDKPMGGARSEREFRVSANEKLLLDGWKGLVAKWGEWVPYGAVEEYMLEQLIGNRTTTKRLTLTRTLERLHAQGRIEHKPDGKGDQLLRLHH